MQLDDGASLVVPPNALHEAIQLKIERTDETTAAPLTSDVEQPYVSASHTYKLTPHGTQFEQPVVIRLPVREGFIGTTVETLWLEDEDDTTWESLGHVAVANGHAEIVLNHFSLITLVDPAPDNSVEVSDPCETDNGGCHELTACTSTAEGRTCGACPSGYSGDGESGCVDIDECATDNGGCDELTSCTNTAGSRACGACPSGYTGDGESGCVDVDECAIDNGGCDELVQCNNTIGGFTCGSCPSGYTGGGESGCVDINECSTDNGGCDALTTCTNTDGSRSCGTCPGGYSGDGESGCVDVDECATDNGGCDELTSCTNTAVSTSMNALPTTEAATS